MIGFLLDCAKSYFQLSSKGVVNIRKNLRSDIVFDEGISKDMSSWLLSNDTYPLIFNIGHKDPLYNGLTDCFVYMLEESNSEVCSMTGYTCFPISIYLRFFILPHLIQFCKIGCSQVICLFFSLFLDVNIDIL